MALKERTRIYECLFMVDPDLPEGRVEEIMNEVQETITSGGGEILRAEVWGKRKLSYEVRNKRFGIYCVIYFKGTGELNKTMNYRFSIHDDIYKNMTVQIDEKDWDAFPDLPEVNPEPEQRRGRRGDNRRRDRRDDDQDDDRRDGDNAGSEDDGEKPRYDEDREKKEAAVESKAEGKAESKDDSSDEKKADTDDSED